MLIKFYQIRNFLKKLFYPSNILNLEIDFLMEELGKILSDSLISELIDTRNEAHSILSMVDGKYSWVTYVDEEKKARLSLLANNKVSELPFGYLMHNIDQFSITSLANTG